MSFNQVRNVSMIVTETTCTEVFLLDLKYTNHIAVLRTLHLTAMVIILPLLHHTIEHVCIRRVSTASRRNEL